MKELSEQIVRDLRGCGHAFMPIDIDLLESAESGARIFLLGQSRRWRDWSFVREEMTHVGIVEETSSGARAVRDTNLALAFAHDLSRKRPADTPHTKACLGAVTDFYRDIRRRITDIGFELDRYCGINDVTGLIRSTFDMGDGRATTLQLQSSVGGRRSISGGVLQADSVLSMYFANEDSEIWLEDHATGEWMLRSPPYGSALLFFGLKVGELKNPEFKSSCYRIEAHSGKSVRASIMHIQIKERVFEDGGADNVQSITA